MAALRDLDAAGLRRRVRTVGGPGPRVSIDGREAISLASNDYLGLAGEERIALDVNMRGCAYFSKTQQVWYRGQVDARKRDRAAGTSHILDHKTGKVKNDYTQLKGFAMWEFLTQPDIHTIKAEYYWTQIRGTNGEQIDPGVATMTSACAFLAPSDAE